MANSPQRFAEVDYLKPFQLEKLPFFIVGFVGYIPWICLEISRAWLIPATPLVDHAVQNRVWFTPATLSVDYAAQKMMMTFRNKYRPKTKQADSEHS